MERGSSLKSPYLIAQCIRLNTNILQGSSANIVGTEPIFVSNAELYSRKHLIINTLHFTQLPQGRLGLWVRAPSGSQKKRQKATTKRQEAVSNCTAPQKLDTKLLGCFL